MSRGREPAPNAVVHPVVDYGVDPWGAGMFSSLVAAAGRSLNNDRAVVPTSGTWSGWVRPLQQTTGAVAALGRARVYADNTSTLSQEKTTDDVTVAAIFRDRMARGMG